MTEDCVHALKNKTKIENAIYYNKANSMRIFSVSPFVKDTKQQLIAKW